MLHSRIKPIFRSTCFGRKTEREETAGPFGGAPTVRHCTDGGVDAGAMQTCQAQRDDLPSEWPGMNKIVVKSGWRSAMGVTGVISRSATHRVQTFRRVLLGRRSPSRSLTIGTFRRIWRRVRCRWRRQAKRYGHPVSKDVLLHRPSELQRCRYLAHRTKHKIDTALPL